MFLGMTMKKILTKVSDWMADELACQEALERRKARKEA
jgi:hypothetical protein